MLVVPAGTKVGCDHGGVVSKVQSEKPLELPNETANNTPSGIRTSSARKSSTGGSHDRGMLRGHLNPSKRSSIHDPPRERSLLRRFSLLPQSLEPICLHRHSLAVELVRNPDRKVPTPRRQLSRNHTTSHHSLHRPALSSPLTEVAFSTTNTSSTSLAKRNSLNKDMPEERSRFKPSRISSSPEISSVVESIYRPHGSSYSSPRRPRTLHSTSSSTVDLASAPESSSAASAQPRPRPRPRPSTHRTRYSYTNNPQYPGFAYSNKRPIWSLNHKPFDDRYPPPPRVAASLYRHSRSTSSRPQPFHPIPPALDSIRRSHSLNSSSTPLRPIPNPNQRPSSHAGTPAPAKSKESLTADEHWNLAHAFAVTPKFTRLGLKADGVVLPVPAKDFRKARRNTLTKSNPNGHPASDEARIVQPTTSRPPPTSRPVPPVATVPSTPGPSPRKLGPNKLRKSRPPSLARPAALHVPSIPQADAKAAAKCATEAPGEEVIKPEVTPGELQAEKDVNDYSIQNSVSESSKVVSVDDRPHSLASSDGASSYFTTPSGSSSLFHSSCQSSSSSVLEFTTRTPDYLAAEENVVLSSDELSPTAPMPPPCQQSPPQSASASLLRVLSAPLHIRSKRNSAPPSPLIDLPTLRSLPSSFIPRVKGNTLDADGAPPPRVTPQANANKPGLMRRFTLRLSRSLKGNNATRRQKDRPNGSEQSERKVGHESPEQPIDVRPELQDD